MLESGGSERTTRVTSTRRSRKVRTTRATRGDRSKNRRRPRSRPQADARDERETDHDEVRKSLPGRAEEVLRWPTTVPTDTQRELDDEEGEEDVVQQIERCLSPCSRLDLEIALQAEEEEEDDRVREDHRQDEWGGERGNSTSRQSRLGRAGELPRPQFSVRCRLANAVASSRKRRSPPVRGRASSGSEALGREAICRRRVATC